MPNPKMVKRPNTPTTPCLATVIDSSGELLPIIPGMALFLILDPTKPEQAIQFTLAKVSLNKLTFQLVTHDGAVQHYEYKLESKQLKNEAALKRHMKNAN